MKKRSPFYRDILELSGIFHGRKAFIGPRFAQIDVTNRCDNECILCWGYTPLLGAAQQTERWKKWAQAELPVELIKQVIYELAEMDTKLIHFAGGGEPFMHPQFIDIIRYVKSLGLQCKITTNFTRVDKKMVQELVDLYIDYLTLSFWSASEKTYQITHPKRKPEMFTHISDNLHALCELREKTGKPWIRIYNVISNLNYHEIEDMYDFGKRIGVDAIEYQIVDPVPEITDHFLMSSSEAEIAVKLIDKVKTKIKNNKSGITVLGIDDFRRRLTTKQVQTGNYDQELVGSMPCYVAWDTVRILANGDVASCLKSDKTPIGNLFQHNFRELWNSPQEQQFRYNAVHLPKSDPFFVKTLCYKTCDNLGDNCELIAKMNSLEFRDRLQITLANMIAIFAKIKP
jgi:MoaA/NifB/PqqE/SkfB family radical SAM enzyme